MGTTDDELFVTLLVQLTEAGKVAPEVDGDVVVLRGQPGQRVPELRLHLTPKLLGRTLRDLAPDYAPVFPRMQPVEAALVAFWVHLMAAVEEARPGAADIELWPRWMPRAVAAGAARPAFEPREPSSSRSRSWPSGARAAWIAATRFETGSCTWCPAR
ncbi:hypothetical protein GCM10023201_21130 [Actinomycetospora corticicola]|uniref:Uncharacterized protein n=1 Tax=Actinomycetospora corticicola TaxID=663602 RepID=A0A7Y9DRG2_9PSEU|nr:hypothetical protein [Actinomycetospora corticicola]NYD34171.1 hypothetical protein [Actinomycetospora corticicola]